MTRPVNKPSEDEIQFLCLAGEQLAKRFGGSSAVIAIGEDGAFHYVVDSNADWPNELRDLADQLERFDRERDLLLRVLPVLVTVEQATTCGVCGAELRAGEQAAAMLTDVNNQERQLACLSCREEEFGLP